ncbi:hypothetical protein M8C21_012142 [Ambrosia artemisiifolia]|uniref:CASP-like protein n=1 Tax=Ambrosia artemisiifolia TaxID=4212 RepID=A0AAD5GQQ2_AMBAR|nr:hypothetical protein M8C21_012142 [Ambrosia artemisiifolia]
MVRNGSVESPSPRPRIHQTHPHDTPLFQSTVSQSNLRRFNYWILVFRLSAFCFSLSSAVFMLTTNAAHDDAVDSPRWYHFGAFRFVIAANSIVALYSLFEIGASVWEIYSGCTVFPEFSQVWFDFGHDQVFAYLLLSAGSTGTELARQLRGVDTCRVHNAFCIQSDIALSLGFVGFLSVLVSSLLSGYRVEIKAQLDKMLAQFV